MRSFGSSIEQAVADAYIATGTLEGAAEQLGITEHAVRARLRVLEQMAAKRGWSPDHDMTKETPEGFSVKGVSTLYGKDGEIKQQWVKTNREQESKLEALAEAIAKLAEPLRGIADPVAAPVLQNADLLNVIPLGDPHLGMYAWGEETGQNFDLQIAERNLVAAVDHLIALAPPADECLIIDLGDFFHADNSEHRTMRSGHALDVDSRWAKVLEVGIRTLQRCIDRALERHTRVRVIIEIGNHDDHSAIMLALCLRAYFSREPRVSIDTSPAKFHWHRFGKNLIGVTHGDTVKKDQLGPIMACDRAADWGETLHRYWYTGHVHHDSLREYPGVIVESFRTLAPRDSWHAAAGYRSGQDLKLDVIHREYGRINRHSIGIHQIFDVAPFR